MFFLWNQSINIIYPNRGMCLWSPIMKRKEIITWTHFYPNWKSNFNYKNGRKRCISCETKPSISFIPMRKMCLWCLIMKKKNIITWIYFYPNWQTNFYSKNGGKWSFSYETKVSIHLSQWAEWAFGTQSERKKDYYANPSLS